MTKEEMLLKLEELGLKKRFKPYLDPDCEMAAILLRIRKFAEIVRGGLDGCEIALCGDVFKIWTCQKQKAKKYANFHKLKVRLMDGEAELLVPVALADEILPAFGARIKRLVKPLTEAQKAALMARLSRNSPMRNEVLGA